MALYLICSSPGKKLNTASISVVFPAALVDWIMTASGLRSSREVPAR